MKRQEIHDYYSAIDAASRLIEIDYKDPLTTIEQKLSIAAGNAIGMFHIEIFQDDENVQSYSLSQLHPINLDNDPAFTLWEQKIAKLCSSSIKDIAQYVFSNMPKGIDIPYTYCLINMDTKNGTITIADYDTMSNAKEIGMPTTEEAKHILGCFIKEDGTIEYHPVNKADTSDFLEIIDNIKTLRVRTFAETFIKIIPDYVFTIPMNDLNKAKSASDSDMGGMKRHCVTMAHIVETLANLNFYKIKFNQAEIDKMIVACLFSSFLSHGWQDEYELNANIKPGYEKKEAEVITEMTGILEKNDLKFIANLIETHTKQDSKESVIDTEYKFLVSTAHFLAGNENISFKSKNGFFVFKDDEVNVVDKTTCMDGNEIRTLRLAIERPIDMTAAVSLDVNLSEEEIRKVWQELINTKRYTQQQQKFINLATKTQFL